MPVPDHVDRDGEYVHSKHDKRCAEQKPQDALLKDELVEKFRRDLPDIIVPVGDLRFPSAVTLPRCTERPGPTEPEKRVVQFKRMRIVRFLRADTADLFFQDFMRHVQKNEREQKKHGKKQKRDHDRR